MIKVTDDLYESRLDNGWRIEHDVVESYITIYDETNNCLFSSGGHGSEVDYFISGMNNIFITEFEEVDKEVKGYRHGIFSSSTISYIRENSEIISMRVEGRVNNIHFEGQSIIFETYDQFNKNVYILQAHNIENGLIYDLNHSPIYVDHRYYKNIYTFDDGIAIHTDLSSVLIMGKDIEKIELFPIDDNIADIICIKNYFISIFDNNKCQCWNREGQVFLSYVLCVEDMTSQSLKDYCVMNNNQEVELILS